LAYQQSEYRKKKEEEAFKDQIINNKNELAKDFMNNEIYEAAKIEYEEVLNLDPYNIEARKGLLKILTYERYNENKFKPAVIEKQLQSLKKMDEKDPHIYVLIGMLYIQQEEYKNAIESLEQALNFDKNVASAWYQSGLAYEYLAEKCQYDNKQSCSEKESSTYTKKAIHHYQKAVTLSEWNSDYLTNLAYIYLKTGEYQKAITHYTKITELDHSYMNAYLEIALTYRIMGMLEESKNRLDYLLDLFSDNEITSLKKNAGSWEYDNIILFEIPEKHYYVLWTQALNTYLIQALENNGNVDPSNEYSKQAESLIDQSNHGEESPQKLHDQIVEEKGNQINIQVNVGEKSTQKGKDLITEEKANQIKKQLKSDIVSLIKSKICSQKTLKPFWDEINNQ